MILSAHKEKHGSGFYSFKVYELIGADVLFYSNDVELGGTIKDCDLFQIYNDMSERYNDDYLHVPMKHLKSGQMCVVTISNNELEELTKVETYLFNKGNL